MKARLLIAVLLIMPCVAHANPMIIDGESLIAFAIVAFWALVIESGIVTLTLSSRGVLIVPSFITLVLANIAIFLFAFLPLTSRVSLWILEPGVVLVDALAIKLFTSGGLLQGGAFLGASWRRALLALCSAMPPPSLSVSLAVARLGLSMTPRDWNESILRLQLCSAAVPEANETISGYRCSHFHQETNRNHNWR